MKFGSIPGLSSIKKILIDSVKNGHMPHAQLFAGPEGTLNLPMALAYATYLHCENKGEDACGSCAACSKNLKYIHPDTHFAFPLNNVNSDKDEERLKADLLKSWRAFLLEQPYGDLQDWVTYYGGENKQPLITKEASREIIRALSLKPFESSHKVMIIWQPELMHPAAANGILKILEEPPAHTYFLLVTNAADRLLPTILSRTQLVSIPLLPDDEIEVQLKNQSVEPKRASRITQMVAGNLNLALKLLDSEEADHAARFTQWMRACFRKNYAELVALADDFHHLDKLNQRNMLMYGMDAFRESLLHLAGASSIHRLHDEELAFARDFSKVLDVPKIEKAYHLLNNAGYYLERNGSPKMVFMDLSLQLSNVIKS